jgi:hypothetical protein
VLVEVAGGGEAPAAEGAPVARAGGHGGGQGVPVSFGTAAAVLLRIYPSCTVSILRIKE